MLQTGGKRWISIRAKTNGGNIWCSLQQREEREDPLEVNVSLNSILIWTKLVKSCKCGLWMSILPSTQAGLARVVPAICPFLQAQRAVCRAMVLLGWLLSRSRVTISQVPAASWPEAHKEVNHRNDTEHAFHLHLDGRSTAADADKWRRELICSRLSHYPPATDWHCII